jgi:hypothetical protein
MVVATLHFSVTGVEDEEPLLQWTEKRTPSEEIEDMIRRAEFNPND